MCEAPVLQVRTGHSTATRQPIIQLKLHSPKAHPPATVDAWITPSNSPSTPETSSKHAVSIQLGWLLPSTPPKRHSETYATRSSLTLSGASPSTGTEPLRVVYNHAVDPPPGRNGVLRPHPEGEAVKVRFDQEADALYLRLGDSRIVESEEVRPGLVVDLDEHGEVVGLEILDVGRRVSLADLKRMDFEVG